MVEPSDISPAPFDLPGGSSGVLLIHDLAGSPAEMRRVGDALHEKGLTVVAPCLPGHGTTLAGLNRVRWMQWTEHVSVALDDLARRCRRVFVGGLSLGAILALYLAAEHPELAGVVCYSPPLKVRDRRQALVPLLRLVVRDLARPVDYFADPEAQKLLWVYDRFPVAALHEGMKLIRITAQRLSQVTCPLLVMYSTADPRLHPRSAREVYRRAAAADKELVTLHRSGHVLPLDCEWEMVAARTYGFIAKRI